MSPGSGVKSEYMKRYQEARWDEYGPCYRALRHYRLGRRLLEQAHAPWLWDDWGQAGASDDSASSGTGAPAPQCVPASPPPPAEPEARVGPEERGVEAAGDAETRDAVHAEDAAPPALPVKDVKEKPERQIRMRDPEKSASGPDPQQPPSALAARGSKSPQSSSTKIKEEKHPFALYGWGERQTDTGSQKTHNVCASAPVREIRESALRAKSRRQVEKRRLAAQRQRAHSADVEKNRRVKPASSENPWMTEYMRRYSARA
ncbi:LOW QUALITY PROTEIN: centriole, cilia and spindle-associated protein-like [Dama dama]